MKSLLVISIEISAVPVVAFPIEASNNLMTSIKVRSVKHRRVMQLIFFINSTDKVVK